VHSVTQALVFGGVVSTLKDNVNSLSKTENLFKKIIFGHSVSAFGALTLLILGRA